MMERKKFEQLATDLKVQLDAQKEKLDILFRRKEEYIQLQQECEPGNPIAAKIMNCANKVTREHSEVLQWIQDLKDTLKTVTDHRDLGKSTLGGWVCFLFIFIPQFRTIQKYK